MSSAGVLFPGGVGWNSLGVSLPEPTGKLSLGFPRGPVQCPFRHGSHHLGNGTLIFYNSSNKEPANKPELLTGIDWSSNGRIKIQTHSSAYERERESQAETEVEGVWSHN